MAFENFEAEVERKDKLLNLLHAHADQLRFGFFDRIFNGVVKVTQIGESSLRVNRESGVELGQVILTSKIVKLFRVNDHMAATLGLRHRRWHLIAIKMLGSEIKDHNGVSQMHFAVNSFAISASMGYRPDRLH